jgi:mannan endo-1,4-beta-mannosidase
MQSDQFVAAVGTRFTLADKPFFPIGVNNHYLSFGTEGEVTRVLDDAVAMGANVVRTILQPVIGSLDGSVTTIWDWKSTAGSSDLGVNGTYLLYWDNSASKMAINDRSSGMGKVDFMIAEAKKRNIKLIIALLDFWSYTGGAQQMRAWYGSSNKNSFFFTDLRTKQDYRTWVHHVLRRVNAKTGLRYKDDPTIFGWELMNEPNAQPDSLKKKWIAEMSAYVKSEDPNHLVGSGHANITERYSDSATHSIDFVTWHGYPLFHNLSVRQFDHLINEYCGLAAEQQKPVLLEEFGYARSNPDQAAAYKQWLDTLNHNSNCAGWLVWRLVARQQNGKYPADEHDQFDVHNDGSPVWEVLKGAASEALTTRGGGDVAPAEHGNTRPMGQLR